MTSLRVALRSLLVIAFAAVPVGLAAPDAGAWTEGVCPTASGVTVIIDFRELGGGIHVRCAPGAVGSGFEALQKAGIDYQTTIRQPGFLCKIAGKPSNDPCIDTSPASAYWSYWLAPRGGNWCYSNWGAGARTPPQGSVEGWSFALDKSSSSTPPPGMAPPAPVAGSPAGLPAKDCDPSATAPTSPPTTAPPATAAPVTAPPATAPPSSPAPNGSANGSSGNTGTRPNASGNVNAPGTAGGSNRPGTAAGANRPAASVAGETSVPAADDPSTEGVPDTTPAPTDSLDEVIEADETTAAPSTTARGDSTELAGSEVVNLSGDDDSGSPVGVIATVGLLAVVGTGVFVMKRRGKLT